MHVATLLDTPRLTLKKLQITLIWIRNLHSVRKPQCNIYSCFIAILSLILPSLSDFIASMTFSERLERDQIR